MGNFGDGDAVENLRDAGREGRRGGLIGGPRGLFDPQRVRPGGCRPLCGLFFRCNVLNNLLIVIVQRKKKILFITFDYWVRPIFNFDVLNHFSIPNYQNRLC